MNPRPKLILYLLLNVIVSAVTTLAVLYYWDATHKIVLPPVAAQPAPAQPLTNLAGATSQAGAVSQAGAATNQPVADVQSRQPSVTETLPPAGEKVIEILSVIGAGDLQSEVVVLQRVGEGNLRMVGWKLAGEGGATFTFPEQPELILYKDGAVQLYSKTGESTATDVYWNRTSPAWKSGETIKLLDSQGAERAIYKVP